MLHIERVRSIVGEDFQAEIDAMPHLVLTPSALTALGTIHYEDVVKKLPKRPPYDSLSVEFALNDTRSLVNRAYESNLDFTDLEAFPALQFCVILQHLGSDIPKIVGSETRDNAEDVFSMRAATIMSGVPLLLPTIFFLLSDDSVNCSYGYRQQSDYDHWKSIDPAKLIIFAVLGSLFGAMNSDILKTERKEPTNIDKKKARRAHRAEPQPYKTLRLTKSGLSLIADESITYTGAKRAHVVRRHPRLLKHERYKVPRVIWIKSHVRGKGDIDNRPTKVTE